MKNFIILLLSLFLITSCGNPTPDDKIQGKKTEAGAWVFDSTLGKNVQKEEVYYLISPTLKQSFYFAEQRPDRKIKVFVSIFFLVLFIVIFWLNKTDIGPEFLQNGYFFGFAQFAILVTAFSFFLNDPLAIRWNNDKWIKKEVWEQTMQGGTSRPIWDSLENNCLIIDGPYDCYTK